MSLNISRKKIIFGGTLAGLILAAWFSLPAAQGQNLPGTENAPKVGGKAPMFDLEGFDLKKQLERGPVVLVFYRGFF